MSIRVEVVTHDSKDYWDSVQLRDKVLRKPLGLEYDREALLKEGDSIHIVARELRSQKIVGVLVLKPYSSSVVKVRQVAVDEYRRKAGIGKKLVVFSEQVAKEQGYSLLYAHARNTALAFYQQNHYKVLPGEYLEVGIPHHSVCKYIGPGYRPIDAKL